MEARDEAVEANGGMAGAINKVKGASFFCFKGGGGERKEIVENL